MRRDDSSAAWPLLRILFLRHGQVPADAGRVLRVDNRFETPRDPLRPAKWIGEIATGQVQDVDRNLRLNDFSFAAPLCSRRLRDCGIMHSLGAR